MKNEKNTQNPLQHIRFPECGDFRDNISVYVVAQYNIVQGERDFGYKLLFHLRDHILQTREVKSVTWLLPRVEALLHTRN